MVVMCVCVFCVSLLFFDFIVCCLFFVCLFVCLFVKLLFVFLFCVCVCVLCLFCCFVCCCFSSGWVGAALSALGGKCEAWHFGCSAFVAVLLLARGVVSKLESDPQSGNGLFGSPRFPKTKNICLRV